MDAKNTTVNKKIDMVTDRPIINAVMLLIYELLTIQVKQGFPGQLVTSYCFLKTSN
jgi:hypothetical protein